MDSVRRRALDAESRRSPQRSLREVVAESGSRRTSSRAPRGAPAQPVGDEVLGAAEELVAALAVQDHPHPVVRGPRSSGSVNPASASAEGSSQACWYSNAAGSVAAAQVVMTRSEARAIATRAIRAIVDACVLWVNE